MMNLRGWRPVLVSILAVAGLVWVLLSAQAGAAQSTEITPLIIGQVFDNQRRAVAVASVTLHAGSPDGTLARDTTQPDGSFTLSVPPLLPDDLWVEVKRPHFQPLQILLSPEQIESLRGGETLSLAAIILARRIGAAFWAATAIFILMLALIATGRLHNTLAALVGASLVLGISYLGVPISESLFIFDFQIAIGYVDWNVIFLIMGMMIYVAVVENSGIFQWLALFAYRLSRGKTWLLMAILMVITGVFSAMLDNLTTMLLMTPITVQIALALGINPLALLMPEVMASNVVGISTLIGTPTNILIGSYGGISFNDFLINLTPGVALAMGGLLVYSEWTYRREVRAAGKMPPVFLEKLTDQARITDPANLKKAGWVGAGMLALFIIGENFHLLPAVTALLGATGLLVWIQPDVEEMIEAVDWTTLVFFITLFIVVGAIQEVGVISLVADGIGRLVGNNLSLAMVTVTVLSALLSTVIANIPFTAAMLPVIGFLSATIPGADNQVLFFCLSVGSAFGGNGSLIGASANMVTAGIAERAGYRISYKYFLQKGFPAMLLTVGLALIWLFIRFK